MLDDRKPQLVEQTAKRFKIIQATGAGAAILAGVMILIVGDDEHRFSLGCFIAIATLGVLTYIVGRVLAWWHHG